MAYVTLNGGTIAGELPLQGSKNAALPILAACVLCRGEVELSHCPDITDVRDMLSVLSCLNIAWSFEKGTVWIDARDAIGADIGSVLMKKTRGGILLLGALVGRFAEASIAYPGGCAIGARPIDYHVNALRSMRVTVAEGENGVFAKGMPVGALISLPYQSVGATENAILAAVTAKGETRIVGAAKEPEVIELCKFLVKAGALIFGAGTSTIRIIGTESLHGVSHRLCGDRIAAGTFMVAALMTGGEVVLTNTGDCRMDGILPVLRRVGATIRQTKETISLRAKDRLHAIPYLVTAPYPAFPTDMQSQMLALLSLAKGKSVVAETVFTSRFAVTPELCKMGASLKLIDGGVVVQGLCALHGESVVAKDLRGGAALLLAGLAAEGETKVFGYEYIARGYEDICGCLRRLGAKIVLCEQGG